ncbi:MAG: GNAT family N-acetyltransferase [Candidatus Mariimomonas ferrooxydans]
MNLKPKTILDVGCGLGIYGALCRIYLEGENLYDRKNLRWNKKENWSVKINCIEGFEKYITDLHKSVYNEIFVSDVQKILKKTGDNSYDAVLAIDILEHFRKEDGIIFIKELQRTGKNVILATPVKDIRQVVPENPLEDHLSLWNSEELKSLNFRILTDTSFIAGIYSSSDSQPARGNDNNITIRMYREGDEAGIIKLFKEIFGREMTLDEWRWKYIESHPQKIYISVAVHKEDGIIGHYGGICLPFLHNGKPVQGLAICDVMIHPKFRGRRLFKELVNLLPVESAKDGINIGYGFPNKDTLMKPALLLGLFEKIEDVIEGNKEVKLHNDLVRYSFKLFPLEYSDIRIDYLWESCKHSLYLAVVRDRRYLTWRYKNHPLFSYEIWGLKKRFGRRLYGLAIVKKEEDRVLIMDFLFAEGMFKPLFRS